jgi:hypothetical protein
MPDKTDENPYDELMRQIARIVEDIVKSLPDQKNARFIGCTIISGTNSDAPKVFHVRSEKPPEISYEVIDAEDRIFITALIPPEVPALAYADIRPDAVHIRAGNLQASITLQKPIDVIHSFYRVRHGVMDIVLSKPRVRVSDVR